MPTPSLPRWSIVSDFAGSPYAGLRVGVFVLLLTSAQGNTSMAPSAPRNAGHAIRPAAIIPLYDPRFLETAKEIHALIMKFHFPHWLTSSRTLQDGALPVPGSTSGQSKAP